MKRILTALVIMLASTFLFATTAPLANAAMKCPTVAVNSYCEYTSSNLGSAKVKNNSATIPATVQVTKTNQRFEIGGGEDVNFIVNESGQKVVNVSTATEVTVGVDFQPLTR